MTGFIAAFTESPIDFYKSQIQVQIIRSQSDPNYKREPATAGLFKPFGTKNAPNPRNRHESESNAS